MNSYVYAITDRPEAALPGQLGLDNAELCQVVWCEICAVVSTHASMHVAATASQAWRHEQVVEALMKTRAVLPARFGNMFASTHSIGSMLQRAYPQFTQDIESVRGHVEIGVRFLAAAEHQSGGAPTLVLSSGIERPGLAPGSAYLQAKLTRERALRCQRKVELEMVREVYTTLAGHATAGRFGVEAANQQGISAAFLVPRDHFEPFRAIVGAIADAHSELALLCTGPWPPYSFVGADAARPSCKMEEIIL